MAMVFGCCARCPAACAAAGPSPRRATLPPCPLRLSAGRGVAYVYGGDGDAMGMSLCVNAAPPPRSAGRGGNGYSYRDSVAELPQLRSDHEKTAHPDVLKALVLVSTSMLVVPLEALAETCQADRSFANMPIFIAVGLIGAAVGGLLARQRKEELKRLNDQLRKINTALKRQAKIESFAPSLTYAPVGRTVETEVIVDPRKQRLMTNLRTGKNLLRNQDVDKAVVEFKLAFELAESLGDHLEEKKAARGLGASLQRMGKYREAMKYYSKVLELSKLTGEDSACTEAYGAIADCYTELGDLERAAKFYDKYISRLQPRD